jgi:hypothetical protein
MARQRVAPKNTVIGDVLFENEKGESFLFIFLEGYIEKP